MGEPQTAGKAEWYKWFEDYDRDPVAKFIRVESEEKPSGLYSIHAVFETVSGTQVEGNVNDVRQLAYKVGKAHEGLKDTPSAALAAMKEQAQDRVLQVAMAQEFMNQRQIDRANRREVPVYPPNAKPDAWKTTKAEIARIQASSAPRH